MSEIRTWRWSLPPIKGEGWAIVLADSTGMFSTVSDWGNFSFKWNAFGERDFREFIITLGADYVRGKLSHSVQEWNAAQTLLNVKEGIIAHRRERGLDKDAAREEWDLLSAYSNLDNEVSFDRWLSATSLMDPWEYGCYRRVYESAAWCEHALPRLQALIRSELETERRATQEARAP